MSKNRPRPRVKDKEVQLTGPLAGLRRARMQMEAGNPAAGNTVVGGPKVTVRGPTPGKSTSKRMK